MVRCKDCPVYSECKTTDHEAIMWWHRHEGRQLFKSEKLSEAVATIALEMHRRTDKIDRECPLLVIVDPIKYRSLSERASEK